jgi:hypothetical protein
MSFGRSDSITLTTKDLFATELNTPRTKVPSALDELRFEMSRTEQRRLCETCVNLINNFVVKDDLFANHHSGLLDFAKAVGHDCYICVRIWRQHESMWQNTPQFLNLTYNISMMEGSDTALRLRFRNRVHNIPGWNTDFYLLKVDRTSHSLGSSEL